MNTQPHYGMHHPSVYINPFDARSGGAASPVGLLNFAHWQTGAAEVDAAAAAAEAKDGRRGGVREDIDWDEGSSARRHQHPQQSTSRQRDDRQVSHLRLQEKTRKDAVGAGEQCGPPPPQPPPPPPPPVLSAAQQRHLKQIQHHDRLALEHLRANAEHGGRGREVLPQQQHGGGGVPYGGEEQVGARRPTVQLQHAERHQQHPPQHRPSGQQQQQAGLPLPRYTNSMPPGGPHCPSPIVQVPIYKTLEEALHEQQKQQKLQQQQQQLSQHGYPANLVHPHQSGAIAFTAPSPRMVHGPSQAPTIVPGNKAGYESFTTADRLSSPRVIHPHHQQHQQQQQHEHQRQQQQQQQHERQQQQQQQDHRGRQVHVTVSEGLAHSQQQHLAAQQQARHRSVNVSGRELASPGRGFSGGVDGRASPRGVGSVSQNRPFRGPVPAPPPPPPPLQPVPVQAQRPTTPGSRAGLHVQLSENVNGPGAPSPAIVYAYPSRGGYNMMKLPPGLVQTPRSTRSQVSQRWDPYECVSPAGDNGHNGFRSSYRNKEGAAAVSLEGSPATSSLTGESTGDTATICSESTSTADIDDNSTFIKPLSSLTDVIERGFHGEEKPQGKTDVANPEVMLLHDSNAQESVFETPRRAQRVSFPDSGVKCGDDKENARSKIGVVGGGKKFGGNTGGIYCEQETLSGSKRGGDEIAKQKSFTGSYFQVSPSSFLQPNKRQRNLV